MRTSTHADLLRLMEAATAVALCVLLGNLRLLELPSGGSISLAAVPLLAHAAVRGGRGAVLACWCAGAAHALSGGTIIHPLQLLLDYVVAYGVLATPALFGARTTARRTIGIVIAMLLQLAVTTLSGVLFFSSVAGAAAWRYSLGYNATTALPELVLALVAVPVAIRALQRADPSLAPPAADMSVAARQPRVALLPAPRVAACGAASIPLAPRTAPPELPRRTPAATAAAPTPAGVSERPAITRDRAPITRPAPFSSAVPWRRADLVG
ncbi:MAG: proton-coupled thiamine transporter YuaJ [Thermoleophilia bacterium]|nr:proton-coupled thiamine transporter YuaJ [Thermoleophilia bacterium]